MFKTVIAPIQAWLLSRGQCVACGMPLAKGQVTPQSAGVDRVTCKCGRIFLYDKTKKTYRRALFSEI
jgi:predicted  nucleic acid-binding Zn-ribbon protein